jgi:hypothetical protein
VRADSAICLLAEWAKGSLTADGWVHERPYRVTIDTGASATVVRPDIVARLPERELSRPYVLQTESGETIPVVKEARVELTIGRFTLRNWVFVADIKDDFIRVWISLKYANCIYDLKYSVRGFPFRVRYMSTKH